MTKIDFLPATVSGIVADGPLVTVFFSSQALFSSELGPNDAIPFHSCTLQLRDGECLLADTTFPLSIENIGIDHAGGMNGSFLPADFSAEGPVTLTFEVMAGNVSKRLLVARGSHIQLNIGPEVDCYAPSEYP